MKKTTFDTFKDLKSFETLYDGLSDGEELLKSLPGSTDFWENILTVDEFFDDLKGTKDALNRG